MILDYKNDFLIAYLLMKNGCFLTFLFLFFYLFSLFTNTGRD